MKKSIFKAALIFCMILCLALSLAVFTACTVGQKDTGEDTSGITSGDSDSEGDNTVDNDGGDTSGDSDNTGDETGDNTGDNTGDDTGTPPAEITEEQYAEQNIELLKAHLTSEYKIDNPRYYLQDIEILKVNCKESAIYFRANQFIGGNPYKKFFTAKFDKNIFNSTHKILNETLNKIVKGETENNVEFLETQTILQPEISEELFDEFCDYIKRQSYTYGEETVDFSKTNPENLEIINISNTVGGGGKNGFNFTIIDNSINKIYTGNISSYIGSTSVDEQINEIMNKHSNFYEISSMADFESFDFEKTNGQAQASAEFFSAQNYLNSLYSNKYEFTFNEPKENNNSKTNIKTNIQEFELSA